MFARIMGMSTDIDLTKTTFDPANPAHVASINNQIKLFNDISLSLIKNDVLIIGPISLISLITSLCTSGLFMYLAEGVALAVCAGIIWAGDLWQKRVAQSQECQAVLKNMLVIYKKCITDHGYQITSNASVLELLKTLAPYVPTRALWEVNSNNPVHYPEAFKQILSTPPHRIPFSDRQTEGSMRSVISSVLPAAIVSPENISEVTISRIGHFSVVNLCKKITADIRQTAYGLDDTVDISLSNRR